MSANNAKHANKSYKNTGSFCVIRGYIFSVRIHGEKGGSLRSISINELANTYNYKGRYNLSRDVAKV
jgi:hypothetical protein